MGRQFPLASPQRPSPAPAPGSYFGSANGDRDVNGDVNSSASVAAASNSNGMVNGDGHTNGGSLPNGNVTEPNSQDGTTTPSPRQGEAQAGRPRLPTLTGSPGARASSVDEADLSPGQSHRLATPAPHEQEAGGPRSRAHAHIRSYTDDTRLKQFPRISKPVELIRATYDVVVIGSGYGGAVAASRLARTGQSVCVLERGREKWPGEYPRGALEALPEVHYSGDFAPPWLDDKVVEGGDPTGMFHLIFGKGQNAIVCNGLGGTSLMNANVFMEADPDILAMDFWPDALRRPGVLDKYYKRVEDVLQPEEYPEDWPKLPKVELLKRQAEFLGLGHKWKKVRQTTRFVNGVNSCGVEMAPSALTGQDGTGVNDGSKTTTLVTYLADAWNWGAEMFCECEVRYIEEAKDREGYIVYFAWHGRNRGHFKANLHGDLMWVHAKKAVVLGAGAIGSTEILLRSKAMGLAMSGRVGQEMSGNGDMLAFGYNTDYEVNAIGRPFPSPYNPIGPCITSVIDHRVGHDNPLDGYVIEEGTVPQALAPFFHAMVDLLPGSKAPKDASLLSRARHALAGYGSWVMGPYFKKGAIERTQVYLIMSHDSNQAMLKLQHDKPVLEFLGVGRSDHIKYLNRKLEEATAAVGGTLVQNPFAALLGGQQLTVHPIGGACMARDGTGRTGVVNDAGQLLKGSGSEVHEGILVTDGAVIPCALGANPFATIAALAERSVEKYIEAHDLTVSEQKNNILDLFGQPQHQPERKHAMTSPVSAAVEDAIESESVAKALKTIAKADLVRASGFGFTEVMSGFIHKDPAMHEDYKSTYERAAQTAKNLCESARFFLSVQAFNTKTIVNDPDHRGMLTGTFVCPTIEGSPFMVHRGTFGLFIVDHKAPGTRNLMYDFDMHGINGKKLHFHGYKVVDSSVALAPLHFWRSTSTLYVTISECIAPGGNDGDPDAWRQNTVAKGIMTIQPSDFFSQVMTLTPTGSDLLKRVVSATNFLTFFTRKSLSLFLAPLTPLQYPSQTYSGYINDTPPSELWAIEASDKVMTRLYMWEPRHFPHNDPTQVENLFMIPGAAVDHQIFALPTIPYNAVNYFTRAGYRVFVAVHRIGQLMVAENRWTTHDARLDIRASLEHMRKHYGRQKIYTIAHCMGSVAFACGLLDGTIPADWIRGVTCSQVFMNPVWNTPNMIKIMASPVPLDRLYRMVAGDWFSCATSRDDSLLQRALNELLRLLPDERRELCNNATCHRISLVFGRCWSHRNLNEATHRQIDRFFGGVNATLLHLLMRMGFEGHVTANAPLYHVLTTPRNVARLRGIPFLLFSGADNAVLSPLATEKTYEILCDTFGSRAPPPSAPHHGAAATHTTTNGHTAAVFSGTEGIFYRRRVVPGYGHLDCWMGRHAWKDVYPFVREEVDRVCRGEAYRFDEPDDEFKRKVESGELLY